MNALFYNIIFHDISIRTFTKYEILSMNKLLKRRFKKTYKSHYCFLVFFYVRMLSEITSAYKEDIWDLFTALFGNRNLAFIDSGN